MFSFTKWNVSALWLIYINIRDNGNSAIKKKRKRSFYCTIFSSVSAPLNRPHIFRVRDAAFHILRFPSGKSTPRHKAPFVGCARIRGRRANVLYLSHSLACLDFHWLFLLKLSTRGKVRCAGARVRARAACLGNISYWGGIESSLEFCLYKFPKLFY